MEDLVKAACDGSREALGKLIELYGRAVLGHILKKVLCDRQQAEDMANSAWLKLIEKINENDCGYQAEKGSFYTYFINFFVKRQISDYYTQQKKYPRYIEIFDTKTDVIENIADIEDYQPENAAEIKETWRLRQNAYKEAFRLVFLCGGYPHQQLAFAFSKIIYGKQSNRSVEGGLSPLYNELKNESFSKLAGTFRRLYKIHSYLDQKSSECFRDLLIPMESRFACTMRELTVLDRNSAKIYHSLLEKGVGETCFEDYYGTVLEGLEDIEGLSLEEEQKKISNIISNWVYKVKNRVRKMLDSDIPQINICKRCNFRSIPPCCKNIFPDSGCEK